MHPVILYQMGKVGSSSLKATLEHYEFKSLHIHRYYFRNNERPTNLKRLIVKARHNTKLNSLLKSKKVKVITLYRDPLPRNISSFFQNLDVYFTKKEMKNLNYEKLKQKFNTSFRFHNTPNNWFDIELKRKLDIDVFEFPFDKEKGYSIIKKGNIELLVCTTSKINTLEKEFAQFLELDEFKLINKNVGNNKWYRDLYKEFKDKYKPSEEILSKLYESKTINHFYLASIIKTMRNKWLDN